MREIARTCFSEGTPLDTVPDSENDVSDFGMKVAHILSEPLQVPDHGPDPNAIGEFFSSIVFFTDQGALMDTSLQRSRRRLLKNAMVMAGATLTAGIGVENSFAQQKIAKEAVKYQDKPSGDKQCSNCGQFTLPNGCKVVDGTISPQGYCIVWVKK